MKSSRKGICLKELNYRVKGLKLKLLHLSPPQICFPTHLDHPTFLPFSLLIVIVLLVLVLLLAVSSLVVAHVRGVRVILISPLIIVIDVIQKRHVAGYQVRNLFMDGLGFRV